MSKQMTASPSLPAPSAWTSNGFRYWRIVTETAEIVASISNSYTPHFPPMHAKYEIYTIKRGMARFRGYLEGEQLARAHLCMGHAFGRYL